MMGIPEPNKPGTFAVALIFIGLALSASLYLCWPEAAAASHPTVCSTRG